MTFGTMFCTVPELMSASPRLRNRSDVAVFSPALRAAAMLENWRSGSEFWKRDMVSMNRRSAESAAAAAS